ncbi:MAG: hypothetical protein QM662_11580 [Gordonia sp. (in: high G+C Gram-positive bacteria)]
MAHNTFKNSFTTTWDEQTELAAHHYLADHPELTITARNLTKALRQVLTTTFLTGRDRCRRPLTDRARDLAERAGVPAATVQELRQLTKTADLTGELGTHAYRLAATVAPIAAMVQDQRIPLANAVTALAAEGGVLRTAANPDGLVSRDDALGFVVADLRPVALDVHAAAGAGQPLQVLTARLQEQIDDLAARILADITAKYTTEHTLTEQSWQQIDRWFRQSIETMHRTAIREFGVGDAEDITSEAVLKVIRNVALHPEIILAETPKTWLDRVVVNTGNSYRQRAGAADQPAVVHLDAAVLTQIAHPVAAADPMVANDGLVACHATIATRVRRIADSLTARAASSHRLAGAALLRSFFTDDGELSAVITAADDPAGTEIRQAVLRAAVELAPSTSAAKRATRVAMAALRGRAG